MLLKIYEGKNREIVNILHFSHHDDFLIVIIRMSRPKKGWEEWREIDEGEQLVGDNIGSESIWKKVVEKAEILTEEL